MGWDFEPKPVGVQKRMWENHGPEEKALLELLAQKGDMHIDALSGKSKLPISKTSVLLFHLELNGSVRCLPGKKYTLVH